LFAGGNGSAPPDTTGLIFAHPVGL